ncbi:MAG: hypothetical protein LBQ44_08220 [Treponema sp.]|nr:hypothetical protein [Treponema sp.]
MKGPEKFWGFPLERRPLLLSVVWIGAVLLFGGLLWFFTQPLRTQVLIEKINRELADQGETRRITGVLPGGRASGFGTWYSLDGVSGSGRALVFTLLRGSSAAACAALVDPEGAVEALLPLSENASRILEGLPEPVYRFYEGRIEKAARRPGASR